MPSVNEIHIIDDNGSIVCLSGDNNFIDLISNMAKGYKAEYLKLINEIQRRKSTLRHKKLKCVYIGEYENNLIRIGWGFTKDNIDRVLGVPIIKVEKESYLDFAYE